MRRRLVAVWLLVVLSMALAAPAFAGEGVPVFNGGSSTQGTDGEGVPIF